MMNLKVEFVIGILALASMVSKIQAVTINCEFTTLHGWKTIPYADDPYGCILRSVDITSKTEVTGVTGTHYYDNTNYYVRALNIQGKVCNVIPAGIDNFFPVLKAFAIYGTSLKTVSSDDLKQFPSIVEFWAYDSLLEFIEPQLFKHNPELKYIELRNNKIKRIESNFFNELPRLTGCNLGGNQCGFTKAIFGAKELEELREVSRKTCSGNELFF